MILHYITKIKWGYYDPLQDMFMDIYTYNIDLKDYKNEINKIIKKFKNLSDKNEMRFIIYKLENINEDYCFHGISYNYKDFYKILKNEINLMNMIPNFDNLKIEL
jgi:hypothetical protein